MEDSKVKTETECPGCKKKSEVNIGDEVICDSCGTYYLVVKEGTTICPGLAEAMGAK